MMYAIALQAEPINMNNHTIDRMAAAIARHMQTKHSCSIEDLFEENFSQDEINRYWGDANRLAEKKRPRPTWR